MVEEMNCICIRVRGCTNEWMDCLFLVDEKDKAKAVEILAQAWDDLWEEGEDRCYGDLLGARLTEAGIQFDVYYAETKEETCNE